MKLCLILVALQFASTLPLIYKMSVHIDNRQVCTFQSSFLFEILTLKLCRAHIGYKQGP